MQEASVQRGGSQIIVFRIEDETGVEVASFEAAEIQAHKAIQELRQEGDEADELWEGWQLNVADASGCVLLSIPLKSLLQ